jgi:hypothetical protein
VLAVLAICAALLMAMPAHAATSTVAACDEAALRAAVDDATPGDTITFGCSGTITLTAAAGGPIGIAKNLTIDGSGQSVTISGGGSVGVIEVGPGVTVTLRALTIANGGGYGIYGGILNAGTLNLVESTVSNNAAPAGTGGIRNWGTLNITGSTITGNSGIVGGVHQFNGTLNITESIFSGNIGATTTDYLTTGAIVLSNGSATVTGSTFVGNVGHVAGGINMGFGTTLTVTNSTFSGNASRSLDSAGAIWNDYGSLAVTNSTIVDNFAPHSLYGGNAWFNAGGIVSFPVAPITLANSILAGNEGEFGGNCMFGPGVSDAGGNLSDDISCGFTQGSSGNNVASLNLGPLGDNGGPTPTIALGAGSAAIDAGSCLQATDQRGLPRPGAGSTLCDSGAFELQGDIAPAPQVITFTSTAPTDAVYGGTYEVSATGGGSGNPILFSIDASASNVCSVTGSTVSFIGTGTCTVNANQAGDANYLAAAEVSQGFTVSQAPQVITFAALSDRTFGELDFSVAASASSGLAVTFSATGYCTVSGTTVHLIAAGVCTINANQAGDVNYAPAPSVGQSFLIASADLTPPVLTATQNPSPNSAGWNNSDVTVTWTCTDVGSGVDPAASSLGDGVMTASGTAEASCTDLAGNTVSESHAVFIDKTAPVLTATQSPSANASGWNNADVTVSWNCTDVDSEVDEEASSLGDDVMTASGTAEASCTDLAGNTVSESHAVLIDKTAPVLAATQSPLANANGWNDTDVTVSWNCTDVDSEVDEEASSLGDDVMTASGTAEASCTDLAGNTVSASHAVLIDKTAPVLTIASPLDLSVHAVGVVLTFSSDDATSGVDTTAAMLSGGTGGNSVEVQSGYVITAAGVYTLTVTATDLAGNVETQSRMFTVYDPTAGFVTGGGWITSPAGAYLDAPSLLGKATFGFVSRYKKGANVPTGKTQFKFNAAGLDFESVSYEWLVVAGNKAQFKGTGTINGAGDYAFFLTAMDGDGSGGTGVDRFRIRIWDRTSGGLIYDNQVNAPADADPTTALGGGSIVIHK